MAASLERLIHEAFELESVAPHPSLKANVFAALEAQADPRRIRRTRTEPRLNWAIAVMAIAIAIAAVGSLLLASGALRTNRPTPAAPSPTVTQKYLTVAYGDWVPLRASIDSTNQLCADYSPLCRERTLEIKRLAQQFRSELDQVTVPSQLAPFDRELRQGLDDLVVALDNRVAAIDAADPSRWDAANVSVEQVKFNVIARAIAEMACWPKGVLIGDDSSVTAWPCTG